MEAAQYRNEFLRKSIHLGSGVAPFLYLLLGRTLSLWIATPIMVLFVLADLVRTSRRDVRHAYNRFFGHIMRADEARHFCGATYITIAIVACIYLFDRPIVVAALLFMSVSDALASLVGMGVGGPKLMGKTLAGSLTFFLSAFVIALLCLPSRPFVALAGAVVATAMEAWPLRIGLLRIDDNLTVPLVSGLVMTALLQVA